MLLAAFFETLLSAFTYSAEAGIGRLREKYPHAEKSIEHWEPRWERLHGILIAFAVFSKAASVWFFCLNFIHGHELSDLIIIAATGVYILLFMLTLKILPKVLSHTYADLLSVRSLSFVGGLATIFFFISIPVAFIERTLLHRAYNRIDDEHRPSTEDEIKNLVDDPEGVELEEEEREIIRSVFEFGDTVTREIMSPRVDIIGLDDALSVSEAIDEIKDAHYSRFPVYHESVDDIRGSVHVKELLRYLRSNHGNEPLPTLLKTKPLYVPESMPINDLLKLLQAEQNQMAIVVDEYGGTAGLVTIEDIIEELVGEIDDEYDQQEEMLRVQSDGSFMVDARMPLDEVNEALETNILERDEYDSIGGYIFHTLGRIPKSGEQLEANDCTITIQTASPRQLHKLRIIKAPKESDR